MDNRFFILKNKSPVYEPDLIKWSKWFEENSDKRILKRETVNGCIVSTIFLGINYQLFTGPPLLFETLIINGIYDGEIHRYTTWDQAMKGHHEMVNLCRYSKIITNND